MTVSWAGRAGQVVAPSFGPGSRGRLNRDLRLTDGEGEAEAEAGVVLGGGGGADDGVSIGLSGRVSISVALVC